MYKSTFFLLSLVDLPLSFPPSFCLSFPFSLPHSLSPSLSVSFSSHSPSPNLSISLSPSFLYPTLFRSVSFSSLIHLLKIFPLPRSVLLSLALADPLHCALCRAGPRAAPLSHLPLSLSPPPFFVKRIPRPSPWVVDAGWRACTRRPLPRTSCNAIPGNSCQNTPRGASANLSVSRSAEGAVGQEGEDPWSRERFLPMDHTG